MKQVKQDNGASASADRATRASPEPQSSQGLGHTASVPSAGMFGVLHSYGFPVVEITRVTEQCFWSKGGKYRGDRETRAYLERLAAWSPKRENAERVSAQLVSAEAERDRRIRSALVWFARRVEDLSASGIEARSDEARSGSAEGESPSDAQKVSQ